MMQTAFKIVNQFIWKLIVLKEISKILQGYSANFNDLTVPNYSPDILANFKYAPITSVNVKCSFSSYKYISTFLKITVIISQE